METFASTTCDGLREFLRKHSLPTSGKKDVLLGRYVYVVTIIQFCFWLVVSYVASNAFI